MLRSGARMSAKGRFCAQTVYLSSEVYAMANVLHVFLCSSLDSYTPFATRAPAQTMRFWTYNFDPASPKIITPRGVLHITNVAIKEVFDAYTRTTLTLTQPGHSFDNGVVVAALTPGRTEFAMINVKLEQGAPIIFRADGPNILSVIGWIEEGPSPLQQKPSLSSVPGPSKKRPRDNTDDEESDQQPPPKRPQTSSKNGETSTQPGKRASTRASTADLKEKKKATSISGEE
ncbi:peptidylprolyl isomerase fpr3 [Stygiomarasmius scandens]|uniref:Peptidylprolyl isomerase fpr3 n=1 Tax=Marasmiellus scandens TaxID=2682957 RepID=A0ABR1IWA3_9AGAR